MGQAQSALAAGLACKIHFPPFILALIAADLNDIPFECFHLPPVTESEWPLIRFCSLHIPCKPNNVLSSDKDRAAFYFLKKREDLPSNYIRSYFLR